MRALGRVGHDRPVDAQRALAEARAALAAAAERLAATGVAPAQLADSVPARRSLGVIPRRATMRRIGEGWPLGVILVSRDGGVFELRTVVRATRQVLPGQQAASAVERRALRLAALDAGFAEGAVIALDARRIPLDDVEAMRGEAGPLVLRDGRVLVRWIPDAPDDALAPLEAYLHERLELSQGCADR